MVEQDEVKDVFRKAQGHYLSISDAASCLSCTSQDIIRPLIALYVKKDLARNLKKGLWIYTITEQGMVLKLEEDDKISNKSQMSEGCKLCMYNVNENCEVAETPDALIGVKGLLMV